MVHGNGFREKGRVQGSPKLTADEMCLFLFHLRLASSFLCKGHCDKTKTHLGKGKCSVLVRLPFSCTAGFIYRACDEDIFFPVVLSLREANEQNEHCRFVSTGAGLSS